MADYTVPVVVEKDADGYFASCPVLQGCYSQGTTYEEALGNLRDAIALHIATPVPVSPWPSSATWRTPSGSRRPTG